MNPATIKKLLENVPELRELIEFINSEVKKLNDLSDIKLTDDREIAVEVLARQRAIETLERILEPLISEQVIEATDPHEYDS